MKNIDQNLAGNRKDMNSLDTNHSFSFQEGKDSLSWKQEAKCLEICAHFPLLPWAFYVPLSQPLVPTFSKAIVLIGPWLSDGLLSIHNIYSKRDTCSREKNPH